MNAFAAAEKNGRAAELQRELEELFNRQNQSSSADVTVIPATVLACHGRALSEPLSNRRDDAGN
jgi:hypothetical protein